MNFIKKLLKDEIFKDLKLTPLDDLNSLDIKFLEKKIFTGHHLIGGIDKIIEPNFTVRDTSGLFICDASLFNDFPSSNIHAAVLILANLFAKKFLNYHAKK